jgi:hypothetical protein
MKNENDTDKMKAEHKMDPDKQFHAMNELCCELADMKLDGEYDAADDDYRSENGIATESCIMENDDCHDTLTSMVKWAREIVGKPEGRRSVYDE